MSSKYLSVFNISFQQEFAYRLNFVMWRVRNVLSIILIFYLWDSVFTNNSNVFGYDRDRMLTYVFGVMILRAVVFSNRGTEIAGQISSGDIVNYLLKPIDYFKYWFTRDISSKSLNLLFAGVEFVVLYLLLRPPFFFQTNILYIFLFLVAVVFSILLFYFILIIVSMITFWVPEAGWPGQFLFIGILTTFLSGTVFPIDVLPNAIRNVVYLLPFPYLLFFPLQVYLGKMFLFDVVVGMAISVIWLAVLYKISLKMWHRGLRYYVAFGK